MRIQTTKRSLAAVVTLVAFLAVAAPKAHAQTGWLSGWNYRNPITVSNSSGSTLSNFQVHVVLSSSFDFTKPKSDGSDVRVTASDGTTLIPFYIESWNAGSTSASLWVNVPSIPTAGSTVYLYYGNASAATASSGDATFNFFDDFSFGSAVSASTINTAIGNAISWIEHGQDAVSGGVSYYYDTSGPGWYPQGYPEVSGYILPTLYDVATANSTSNPTYAAQLRTRAQQIADWELTVQSSDGSWIYTFDTGQIVEGLTRAYQETGNSSYLAAAEKAANWLVSVQAADGTWSDFGFPHAYNARISRNLLKLWKVDGNNAYMTAATNDLNWVLTQQQSNGWFNGNGIGNVSENSAPLTHTIAYTMEGLFDSGIILNNATYIAAAKKTADALLALQQPGGMLTGGNYDSNWNATNTAQVLTGDAQTAMMWLKFYNYSVSQGSANSTYLNAAAKMNTYLISVQGNSVNTGIEGGLAGSDPLNGPYETNIYLSWATKFFIDDLNLESQLLATTSINVPAIDPSKWSFPLGSAGFSNLGGVLRYNGPTAGFGPRAIAMKNGTSVPFTDGVVEYNIQGNGANNEFALMYRGQSPETSNTYTFYPTVFNSQNNWQNYKLVSGAATGLGTGGAFIQGTLYSIKAAIGGSSHTFSVNGTQILANTDAAFASGDFGLMAWGNAIASVSNFHLRAYASVDPITTVGSQQVAASSTIASVTLNPTTVTGGLTNSTGTITLTAAAPTGGAVVTLMSSNTAAATVPTSVTVPANSTTTTFTATSIAVGSQATVTITATYGVVATATLTVNPPAPSSLTLNPTSVTGGSVNSTATLTLNAAAPSGGAVVTLTSSNTTAATVPTSVTVAGGATTTTFTVTSKSVAATSTSIITATYNGAATATLTVTPLATAASTVTLNPTAVIGGAANSTGTLTLNGTAPAGGTAVLMTSSNILAATVPAIVTVPANASSTTFTVTSIPVASQATVTITATFGVAVTATLTVNPPSAKSVALNPTSVIGGVANSTGTVTLTGPAPTGGAVVGLTSSNTAVATVPANVTVPGGATSTTFPVTSLTVSVLSATTITATYNGGAPTAGLVVNPVSQGGAPAFVRSAGGSKDAAAYTVAISPTAGDFLGVFVWSATTPTVTDNLGSAYTQDCTITYVQGGGTRQLTVYHLLNAPGGITGVISGSQPWSRTIVAEYSGMPTSGTVLDVCGKANTQNGAVTSWSSTATTTTANDLVFGLADTGATAAAGYKASGAWSGRLEQPDTVDVDDSYLEDQINVAAGSYTATGTTTLGAFEASVVVAFKIGSGPVAPAITSANSTIFGIGVSSSFTVTASGFPPPTLSESGALPSGVTFNAGTGVLSGTPVTGTSGAYPLTFTAHNGAGADAVQTFTLTVSAISFVRSAGGSKDSAAYTVPITPTTGDFLGVFVWSATTPTVSDNLGSAYTRDCTVAFTQGAVAQQLTVFHLLNAPSGITGVTSSSQPWSHTIVAEYSGMPTSGAVLDVCGAARTQNAVTSWSSTATATTATDLVFGLVDTGNTASAVYKASGAWTGRLEQGDAVDGDDSYLEDQINVAAGSYTATGTSSASVPESSVVVAFKSVIVATAPAITSANSATFGIGVAGSFTVTATGFPQPTLSETGALPSGVTFNAGTGVLAGTPAAGTTGAYPITFTAHNGIGVDAIQSFTLTVSAVSFVRSAGASKDSAAYTVAITPTSGDFVGVFVMSATTPTVTDNLGSAYTQDCTITYAQGGVTRQLTVFHLLNAPSGITGVISSSQPWSRTIVAEYSGMPTSGAVLDVCGTARTQTTGSTSWSSAATTTTAKDLVFGLADTGFSAAAGYKASGAWTGRMEQGDAVDIDDSYLEDQVNVAAGSYTATGTTTASIQESSVVVAFKTGF